MSTIGANPPCKAMDRETASVPKLRIGEGAKPGPNDGTKHINPAPSFPSGTNGRQPREAAMKSEVNSVKKGNAGGSSKSVGGYKGGKGFSAKRSSQRSKKN